MPEYVRVCRDCGEEYRPGVQQCADCGGELVDRQLDEDGNPIVPEEEAAEAVAPPAPIVERRVVFVTPQAADLVPLADALREAEIEYHMAEQPATVEGAASRYALLVDEANAAAALQALAPLLAEEEPEDMHALETRFEPGRGYVACPACGAEQPPGATECAECGLAFGAEAEAGAACARCGAPLPEPGGKCPACGSSPLG